MLFLSPCCQVSTFFFLAPASRLALQGQTQNRTVKERSGRHIQVERQASGPGNHVQRRVACQSFTLDISEVEAKEVVVLNVTARLPEANMRKMLDALLLTSPAGIGPVAHAINFEFDQQLGWRELSQFVCLVLQCLFIA